MLKFDTSGELIRFRFRYAENTRALLRSLFCPSFQFQFPAVQRRTSSLIFPASISAARERLRGFGLAAEVVRNNPHMAPSDHRYRPTRRGSPDLVSASANGNAVIGRVSSTSGFAASPGGSGVLGSRTLPLDSIPSHHGDFSARNPRTDGHWLLSFSAQGRNGRGR